MEMWIPINIFTEKNSDGIFCSADVGMRAQGFTQKG